MASKTVLVGSAVGLHARPAALIAQAAGQYDDEILLSLQGSDEDSVDAASSLMIMTLGAAKGAAVTVESENAEAVEQIAALIERDLDAE
jgi:phosphocarrier protein